MTKCRFWENRYLPIEYSLENMQSTEGYFSLCLIKRGNAVVSIDGIKCYLSAPALLCLNPDRKAEIIRSAKLQMKTIFFAPEFINRNLSVERITADDYELNCRLFDFPSFDLFYRSDDAFNGIIPFESEELGKVEYLFDSIIEQLRVQPDNMWSCRARMAVIRIFDYAANLYEGLFGVNQESDTLVDCILTFIEFNLEKQFKDFDYTETYIIDSEETIVNGHKLIITTRQMTEGGEIDYGATMYFEDWGYVVGGGAYGGADKDELLKIMQNLSLEEDTDYVPETTSADMVRSDLDLKRLEYDRIINTEFTMHKLGEAFKWGHEAHSDDFTVKVTSIKEQTGTNDISEEYWNWTTDYFLIHSDFFDENGNLITPYTRHDINDSDGLNTQRKEWDTEDNRHFFVVTVEITQNSEKEFDLFGDFSPAVLIRDKDGSYRHNGEEDKNGVVQSIIYGNIDTVLSTPGDETNVLHMSKGETRILTYGIVVDDDVLDNAYLRFNSSDNEIVDDKAETITLNYFNDCVKIKE